MNFICGIILTGSILLGPYINAQTPAIRRTSIDEQLSESMLLSVGLHLREGSSLESQIQHQSKTRTRIALVTIDWDVLPGAAERIGPEEISKWPRLNRLSIKKYEPILDNYLCGCSLVMNAKIWVFGLSTSNEVLTISNVGDTRWENIEGQPTEIYRTKQSFRIATADDPKVVRLGVYESHLEANIWSLVPVGMIQIPDGAASENSTSRCEQSHSCRMLSLP